MSTVYENELKEQEKITKNTQDSPLWDTPVSQRSNTEHENKETVSPHSSSSEITVKNSREDLSEQQTLPLMKKPKSTIVVKPPAPKQNFNSQKSSNTFGLYKINTKGQSIKTVESEKSDAKNSNSDKESMKSKDTVLSNIYENETSDVKKDNNDISNEKSHQHCFTCFSNCCQNSKTETSDDNDSNETKKCSTIFENLCNKKEDNDQDDDDKTTEIVLLIPEDINNLPKDNFNDPPILAQLICAFSIGTLYCLLLKRTGLFVSDILQANFYLKDYYLLKMILSARTTCFFTQSIMPLLNRRFLLSRIHSAISADYTDNEYQDSRGIFSCILGSLMLGVSLGIYPVSVDTVFINAGCLLQTAGFALLGFLFGSLIFSILEKNFSGFKTFLNKSRISKCAFVDLSLNISYTTLAFFFGLISLLILKLLVSILPSNDELPGIKNENAIRMGVCLSIIHVGYRCYCRKVLDGIEAFSTLWDFVPNTVTELYKLGLTSKKVTVNEIELEEPLVSSESKENISEKEKEIEKEEEKDNIKHIKYYILNLTPATLYWGGVFLTSLLFAWTSMSEDLRKTENLKWAQMLWLKKIYKILLIFFASAAQAFGSRLSGGSLLYHTIFGVTDFRWISLTSVPIIVFSCTVTTAVVKHFSLF